MERRPVRYGVEIFDSDGQALPAVPTLNALVNRSRGACYGARGFRGRLRHRACL